MPHPELCELAELVRQLGEAAVPLETPDRPELDVSRSARTGDVRVVRVRQPVGPAPSCGNNSALAESERRFVRAEEREQLGNLVCCF